MSNILTLVPPKHSKDDLDSLCSDDNQNHYNLMIKHSFLKRDMQFLLMVIESRRVIWRDALEKQELEGWVEEIKRRYGL